MLAMRGLLVLAAALVLALPVAAAARAHTDLRIRVWPDGTGGRSKLWTLRCGPVGGTLPRPARACRVLASIRAPFAPVPSDAVCSEIYGGPQVALVTGTFRGRRVWTWFRRRNGCETARWARVQVLFPIRA